MPRSEGSHVRQRADFHDHDSQTADRSVGIAATAADVDRSGHARGAVGGAADRAQGRSGALALRSIRPRQRSSAAVRQRAADLSIAARCVSRIPRLRNASSSCRAVHNAVARSGWLACDSLWCAQNIGRSCAPAPGTPARMSRLARSLAHLEAALRRGGGGLGLRRRRGRLAAGAGRQARRRAGARPRVPDGRVSPPLPRSAQRDAADRQAAAHRIAGRPLRCAPRRGHARAGRLRRGRRLADQCGGGAAARCARVPRLRSGRARSPRTA